MKPQRQIFNRRSAHKPNQLPDVGREVNVVLVAFSEIWASIVFFTFHGQQLQSLAFSTFVVQHPCSFSALVSSTIPAKPRTKHRGFKCRARALAVVESDSARGCAYLVGAHRTGSPIRSQCSQHAVRHPHHQHCPCPLSLLRYSLNINSSNYLTELLHHAASAPVASIVLKVSRQLYRT